MYNEALDVVNDARFSDAREGEEVRSLEFSAAEHLVREVLAMSSIQKVKIAFALLLEQSTQKDAPNDSN